MRIGHHEDEIVTNNTPVASARIELVYDISGLIKTANEQSVHCAERTLTQTDILQKRHLPCDHVPSHAANFHVLGGTDGAQVCPATIKNLGELRTRDAMKFRGSMALNRCRAVHAALQTWMSVSAPLGKVDQFALPDFNFNAVENRGLVTYRAS